MENIRLYWRFNRFLCRWACALHFKLRIYGRDHVPDRGPVLLVSNHQSLMDPVIVSVGLRREASYMARDSLFEQPLFRKLITSLNAYPVKRNTADIGAIKESLRRLKHGDCVVLFPEGTRTADGRIGPMLPGLGAIARKAKVPIVPTLIDGLAQAWPRDRMFPSPGNVIVEYDRMWSPEEFADLSAEELMERIRLRLVEMQARWHGRLPERRLEFADKPGRGTYETRDVRVRQGAS